MSKRHHGSTLDDFLREEGTFEEDQALAIKEVVVCRSSWSDRSGEGIMRYHQR